jgi:aldehyde:ferredoxin oxidoreductase
VEESSIRDPFIANPQEVQVLVDMENALATLDATGGCKFMGILLTAEEIAELIMSATGWDFSVPEFRRTGERIYNLERAFCVREGLHREQEVLPVRLMEDPLPDGPAEGMRLDWETMEMMKDSYYQRRGWDQLTGVPTPKKLQELGLEMLIQDLWG